VHTFNMMRAMATAGHTVALLTSEPVSPEISSNSWLSIQQWPNDGVPGDQTVAFSSLQERFRSYWGVSEQDVRQLARAAASFRADAVIVSGLEVLPLLAGIKDAVRVWYAADEWVLHHVTQIRVGDPRTWMNLQDACIKGLYEWAFGPLVDRAWVVSDADRSALRFVMRIDAIDVLPNGIDADFFQPQHVEVEPESAVFWGRLDFGPNIQALQWFCTRVWPIVRKARPDAKFTIIGFHPTPAVMALAHLPGVQVKPNLPDLRSEVARHAVVALPFVSGGGIKNKLLEAAAMGKPVVCTPIALRGARGAVPYVAKIEPQEWSRAMIEFWRNPASAKECGLRAREWVSHAHTWDAVAEGAVRGLRSLKRS
jgi:glycosyltransferase involved in cell wall biosynthesis